MKSVEEFQGTDDQVRAVLARELMAPTFTSVHVERDGVDVSIFLVGKTLLLAPGNAKTVAPYVRRRSTDETCRRLARTLGTANRDLTRLTLTQVSRLADVPRSTCQSWLQPGEDPCGWTWKR